MRIIVPTGPPLEDADRRAAELTRRAPEMYALLEPTAQQGAEADPHRLEFGQWAQELGTAHCDADRPKDGVPLLDAAAQVLSVVVHHLPEDRHALRLWTGTVAQLAEELMMQQRSAAAWEWAAGALNVAKRLAVLDPDRPDGPLAVSRLDAVLASLSPAKQPPPPAYMQDEDAPGGAMVAVEPFYAFLSEAVDSATMAFRTAPDHVPARLQLGQEAWNLAMYLETHPGLPGGDCVHYARLVVEALEPLETAGRYDDLCTPALRWARHILA
jgi:hypothetical protein